MLKSPLLLAVALASASLPVFGQTTVEYASGTNDASPYSTSGPNNPLTLSVLSGTAEQSGDITGSGGVIKAGTGSLILSGSNSYSGGTTLQEGTLRLSDFNPETLGSGTLTITGGAVGNAGEDGMAVIVNDVAVASDFSIDAQGEAGSVEIFGNVALGAPNRTITLTSEGLACFGGNISGENFELITTSGTSQAMFCDITSNTFTGTLRVGAGVSLDLWKLGDIDDPPVTAISGDLLIDAGAAVHLLVWDQFGPTTNVEVNGSLVGELPADERINAIQALSGTGTITSDVGGILSVSSGTFAGTISGDQSIIKANTGTLVLAGSSTYTGGTDIEGGALRAQNNHALGNGSVRVSNGAVLWVDAGVSLDIGGNTITLENDGASTYRKDFAQNEDYAQFGAIVSSDSNETEARLLGGTASAAVSIEATFAEDPSTPASNDEYRISDVFSLDGINGDTFVMQLSYTQDAYEAAALAGLYSSEMELTIGFLDGSSWVSLGTGTFVDGAWNSSYTAVGTHGVDTANNVVWVVTNHNSEFAIVPEPTTAGLLALAALAGLGRRRR